MFSGHASRPFVLYACIRTYYDNQFYISTADGVSPTTDGIIPTTDAVIPTTIPTTDGVNNITQIVVIVVALTFVGILTICTTCICEHYIEYSIMYKCTLL